jgi:two-component system response regulator FixJ
MRKSVGAPPVVIVVDDNPAVLSSLKFAFEIEGFEVIAYADAEALLDGAPLPDQGCLALDYRLPGMNGLALLRRFRALGDILPAILITTPNAVISRRAAAADVTLVEKPLLCDTLITRGRHLLITAEKAA